jgi:hypothetical protein
MLLNSTPSNKKLSLESSFQDESDSIFFMKYYAFFIDEN